MHAAHRPLHGRPALGIAAARGRRALTRLASAWEKTYAATTRDEMLDAYSEWASSYDRDSLGLFGYAAPAAAAEALKRLLPDRVAPILDAGAGTGLVGAFLAERGFTELIGVDLSPEMLEQARRKGCYRALMCRDLADADLVPQRSLGAVVSVGTVTPKHVEEGSLLRGWASWVRPGGLVCLSVRTEFWDASAAVEDGVAPTCEALEAEGAWRLVEVTADAPYTPHVEGSGTFHVRTYRVVGDVG